MSLYFEEEDLEKIIYTRLEESPPQGSGMTCQHCGQREGTEIWAEDGVLAWAHGMYQKWCKRCVVEAQLAHAKAMAAQIPELEQRLASLPPGEE